MKLWNDSTVIDVVGFVPMEAATWTLRDALTWFVIVLGGLEVLAALVLAMGPLFNKIPIQGRHLDTLSFKGAWVA
jgi:hypothetical protein